MNESGKVATDDGLEKFELKVKIIMTRIENSDSSCKYYLEKTAPRAAVTGSTVAWMSPFQTLRKQ